MMTYLSGLKHFPLPPSGFAYVSHQDVLHVCVHLKCHLLLKLTGPSNVFILYWNHKQFITPVSTLALIFIL